MRKQGEKKRVPFRLSGLLEAGRTELAGGPTFCQFLLPVLLAGEVSEPICHRKTDIAESVVHEARMVAQGNGYHGAVVKSYAQRDVF